VLKKKESNALWESVRDDDVQAYLDEYGGERLPDATDVR
jgi:hypothetical protein